MSSAAVLPIVQQYLTRYGMTAYVILGSIGSVINTIMFSQPAYRRTPCALYILAMSFSGLSGLNISALPIIWALDHPSPFLYNQVACGMFFYFRHSFNQIFRTFFAIVCVDRYACCSDRQRIRSFSQYKVAVRVVPSIFIFWFLVPIFPTLLRTLSNGVCDARAGVYDIIYTIYINASTGIVPLICMITFGILMLRSLKKMRRRVQPTTSVVSDGVTILRKRDRDMMRMLLVELILCTITLSPNTVLHIYKSATGDVTKTKERQQIETFTYFLGRLFLLYMANTFSFYVYITTSQTYRSELRALILKWYRFMMGR